MPTYVKRKGFNADGTFATALAYMKGEVLRRMCDLLSPWLSTQIPKKPTKLNRWTLSETESRGSQLCLFLTITATPEQILTLSNNPAHMERIYGKAKKQKTDVFKLDVTVNYCFRCKKYPELVGSIEVSVLGSKG